MPLHNSEIPTPLIGISIPLFDRHKITVSVKRDDLNHPFIQGNKWHKLKLNLAQAKQDGKDTIITFGGAYSNHIAATAFAAHEQGFKCIAFIRGDELAGQPNRWSSTLKTAAKNGMQLRFLSRQAYREKDSALFLEKLHTQFNNTYLLPEGGSNPLAVSGFESLMRDIEIQQPNWTHLYTAVGTGATLAGLVKYAKHKPKRCINGVAVLKQAHYLLPQIEQWIGPFAHTPWHLLTGYHGGGYGKVSAELNAFKHRFEQQFNIPLDPVYTLKMVHAFYQALQLGQIKAGSNIILLHTGGLQGNAHTPIKLGT